MNVGLNNTVNLDWSQYEGFDVSQYMIFSQSLSSLEFIQFATGNVTNYVDLNPPTGTSVYQVRVVLLFATQYLSNPNANFALIADTLKSNIVEHDYVEENDDLSLSVIVNHPSCEIVQMVVLLQYLITANRYIQLLDQWHKWKY